MRPEVEQELSHTLLVELLAYQFASPVRWIETQDAILEHKGAERLIEVGPSDTLSAMASRTLASKYEAYDAAKSVQRQILCYGKDGNEIYYAAGRLEEEPQSPPSDSTPDSTLDAPVTVTPAVTTVTPPSSIPAARVPDEPVAAVDIVRSLIAQKLKKSLLDIPLNKAIKDLVGGKSTLQNEIVGDLNKEFGSTPEKSEDIPLDELGAAFQATFDGQLGKQSQSLIARLVSSKMPGGFSVSKAREHLEKSWGLGAGRRDASLLLALTMEPDSRLSSEADARAFLDAVAQRYAVNVGINLSSAPASSPSNVGNTITMDHAAVDALTKDQKALHRHQLGILARYLKADLRAGDKALKISQDSGKVLQAQLDLWIGEHGQYYAIGIEPIFTPLKARIYDSAWNWARQDAIRLYFDMVFGKLRVVNSESVGRFVRMMNRSNAKLVEFMEYHISHCPTERGETYELAKELGEQLIAKCKDVLDKPPVYLDVTASTGPLTTTDERGQLNYEETPRASCKTLQHYVQQMAEGETARPGNWAQVHSDTTNIHEAIKQHERQESQLDIRALNTHPLRSTPGNQRDAFAEPDIRTSGSKDQVGTIPFLHLKRKTGNGWEYDKALSTLYLSCLKYAAKSGLTFEGKHVLMTGAGAGSIGAEVLQGLISGGAKVVVTTSQFSRETTEYYQSIYASYGSRGSQLIVVPFNQGSKQDVDALVKYIYDQKAGLGWDLDSIIPFAAISETGRQIDGIDSQSELAHRIMLTNLLRLLGSIKAQKSRRGFETRPTQVLLPLSPNHGTFGNDGLYSESKLALETLFNRWHSESWADYLTICGAVIGWTRGTGLMSGNNIVAEGIEALGVRTFSQREMAFNLLGLMSPMIVDLCQSEPVFAELTGGLQLIPNLNESMVKLRKAITEASEIQQAVAKENAIENGFMHSDIDRGPTIKMIEPRANIKLGFPPLPDWKRDIAPLHGNLKGMVDLEKVVVVTGFGEVGPWGGSRTRWEMEAYGEFSLEGCIEMAWIMGLIKHHNGILKGKPYAGWVDAETGEPVIDKDVKARYESHILDHAGIRLIEPELFGGYDPNRKQFLQEVIIGEGLEPFETSKETAEQFKLSHGSKVDIFEIPETGEYVVHIKKGAALWIPKALRFDRLVAGQIPTGWDAGRYGIPEDIISQVDIVTLYLLVSVTETLISCGITDPYEFYKYVHVSELGNCIGSGMGGAAALRGMHKDRFLDKPLQTDIFQEAFVNTMSAWVNMLLLSSSGPIKTPSGACATAVESLEMGHETIIQGKARVCFVGGLDDLGEEGSYEFGNMGATSNSVEEFAHGRTPQEMSRPAASTRSGFMESQGSGTQIIMTAKLALEMGVPIYGIVALTTTASDKIGRSIPAPGQGLLTIAREKTSTKFPNPLLDIHYRRRQITQRKKEIQKWKESELTLLYDEMEAVKTQGVSDSGYLQDRVRHIEKEATREEDELLQSMGNHFWREDPSISPIRGALATWGLTIDDLAVASFHGTSTQINEKNESSVIQQQFQHLGREKGNPVMAVFQKHLTGHPKGAAGAWMLNGCLQILGTGLIPGNRNADNLDPAMEQFDHVVYPRDNIQTDGIKAFSLTSFGFGQKGAQAVGVHPKYLFAVLDEHAYTVYCAKTAARQREASRYFHKSFISNSLFAGKSHAPYSDDQLRSVLLNPSVRAWEDKASGEFRHAIDPKA
ncbi:beta subunit of fatty acid synthetase [Fusarium falciforme]